MEETLDINYKGNILEVLKQIQKELHADSKASKEFDETASKSLSNIEKSIKQVSFASIHQGIQNLQQGLEDLNRPGLDFSSSIAEVSAITGVVGKDLDELGSKARASAKEFGGTATDSLESYKTILSRLGPQMAQDKTALAEMEKNVRVLSKTMGGDAAGAVDALTTGMLQYGIDLSKPAEAQKEMAKMMNVMAAGAQEGAAEVPQISAALKVSGVAAKQAKVSFEETNSALQALAAGGRVGSEAGVSLRNVLGKMAGEDVLPKEAADKLKRLGVDMKIVSDTTLPFTTRLRELKKASSDATIMAQVFGTENAAAANILLESVDAQDELTKKITGTSSALEQAAIIMESPEEKLSRMRARIDDAKLAFFELTGGVTAYLGPITEVGRTVQSLSPIYAGAKTAVLALATAEGRQALVQRASTAAKVLGAVATKTITAAQWLWNAALSANPIGLVITAVAALGAAIYASVKAFDKSTAAQRLNAEVTREVNKAMIGEQIELKRLFTQLKQTNPGTEERTKLIDELKSKYPGLIEQYDLEHAKLSEIDKIQKEVIKNVRNKIEADIKTKKATELLEEAEDAKGKSAFQLNLWTDKQKWDYIKDLQNQAEDLLTEADNKINSGRKKITEKGVPTKPTEEKKQEDQQSNPLVSAKGYDTEDSINEQIKVLREQKASVKLGGTEYLKLTAEINKLESKLSGKQKGSSKSYGSASGGASGTGEMKRIDVRIETLVKELHINTTNLSEGIAEAKKKVSEALIGAVRDFEVAM